VAAGGGGTHTAAYRSSGEEDGGAIHGGRQRDRCESLCCNRAGSGIRVRGPERGWCCCGCAGEVKTDPIRTSSQTFLRRGHDKVTQGVEERLARWAMIPVENGEDMQVGGWVRERGSGPDAFTRRMEIPCRNMLRWQIYGWTLVCLLARARGLCALHLPLPRGHCRCCGTS
jgi:hypothetical protein